MGKTKRIYNRSKGPEGRWMKGGPPGVLDLSRAREGKTYEKLR